MDYTLCAQRLVCALYPEFTDWEAVFAVVEEDIENTEFIQKMFKLLKVAYSYIKQDKNEDLLRSHAKRVILCLSRINRQTVNVDTVDQMICSIMHVDKELKLIGNVSETENSSFDLIDFSLKKKNNELQIQQNDCHTLAEIITDMSAEVNMLRMYAAQSNMMSTMNRLREKGFIANETQQARIDACLTERSEQQQLLQQINGNFDENRTILYTAMKLNVLAELQLINDEPAMRQICIECDRILMDKSLDFSNGKNHTFLGKRLASPPPPPPSD